MSRPSDIELARAREIVRVMTYWKFAEMGIRPDPAPDLQSYDLREMLDAAHMVRDFGNIQNDDGTISMMVIPDDRLIAALYTITNYHADEPEDIETIVSGRGKALVCMVMS